MSFMRETLYCGLLISTWQNSKIMATPTKIVPKNPVFTGEVCLCCKINFLISGRRKYLVTDSINIKKHVNKSTWYRQGNSNRRDECNNEPFFIGQYLFPHLHILNVQVHSITQHSTSIGSSVGNIVASLPGQDLFWPGLPGCLNSVIQNMLIKTINQS